MKHTITYKPRNTRDFADLRHPPEIEKVSWKHKDGSDMYSVWTIANELLGYMRLATVEEYFVEYKIRDKK